MYQVYNIVQSVLILLQKFKTSIIKLIFLLI